MNETLLDRAMRYRAMGLSVIPAQGKLPNVAWKDYQSRLPSIQELEGWFGPGIGDLGIVTGRVSGIVVVDCDSPEAVEWAEKALPMTPMRCQTKKGLHLYYRHPGGSIVRNKVQIDTLEGRTKIDIRGDGGFVVGPGSVHPDGDILYVEVEPWTIEMMKALPVFNVGIKEEKPVSMPQLIPTSSLDVLTYVNNAPPAIEGQGGDAKTFSLACDLIRGFCLSKTEALPLMEDWNKRCKPKWRRADLWRKLVNAEKYGKNHFGYLMVRNEEAESIEEQDHLISVEGG